MRNKIQITNDKWYGESVYIDPCCDNPNIQTKYSSYNDTYFVNCESCKAWDNNRCFSDINLVKTTTRVLNDEKYKLKKRLDEIDKRLDWLNEQNRRIMI
ncbi:hypothetical protein [uncultured Arcobacter sp.]|uniref:hypothetical protein n=1 Tax=uncultured Arcobacter sp. TaxID=165434 RepID=UPI002627A0ED|nr:hypothetical protein [uncultured Arcobacter sp.]